MKRLFFTSLLVVLGIIISLYLLDIVTWDKAQVRLVSKSGWGARLSLDKLQFKYGFFTTEDALCIADKSYRTGKYYYEVEYRCFDYNKPSILNMDIGIIDVKSHRTTIPPDHDTDNDFYGLPVLENSISDGYILGIAADLDNGKIYFRINGVWINCSDYRRSIVRNGNPEIPGSGLPIATGVEYAAAVFISSYGQPKPTLNANFGHKPFNYKIPRGFLSYDRTQKGETSREILNPPEIMTYPDRIPGEDGSFLHSVVAVNAYSKTSLYECSVKIPKQDTPITLALISQFQIRWNIDMDRDTVIRKIYVLTSLNSQSVLVGGNPKIPVVNLANSHFKNLDSIISKNERFSRIGFLNFISDMKIKTGMSPATVQAESKPLNFVIDGKNSLKKKWLVFNNPMYDDSVKLQSITPCCIDFNENRLEFTHSGERNPNVSDDKKLSTAKAIASVFYNRGKRYLEFTYIAGDKGVKRNRKTEIGIIEDLSVRSYLWSRGGGEAGKAYGIMGNRQIVDGQTIGIAIDYDNWRLHYTTNGDWYWKPGQANRGTYIEPYRNYAPGASIERPKDGDMSERWVVNFGAEPFIYKIPEGFSPYDETINN